MKRLLRYALVSLTLILAGVLVTAQITLTTFQPNTPIRASEVNSNFATLESNLETLINGGAVTTLNTLTGDLSLVPGSNIDIIPDPSTGQITINSTTPGGGGGDITAVFPGVGLLGGGTSGDVALDVDFSGSGSAGTVARSDHDHLGQIWSGVDTPLVLDGSYSPSPFNPGEQKGAPLVLTNTDTSGSGLRVTTANNGVFIDSADFSGVYVESAGFEALAVMSTAIGLRVYNALGDGVLIDTAGRYGGNFTGDQAGVVAEGKNDIDLIVGDFNNGRIISAPLGANSDLFLESNETVVVRLDRDQNIDPDSGTFQVRNGDAATVFAVHENGDVDVNGVMVHSSDRDRKENLVRVDAVKVLDLVSALPLYRWNFIEDEAHTMHLGPVAQDFYATFGLGNRDTHIAAVDADGVALAAIQGLYQLLEENDAVIAEQQRQLEALEERLAALERALVQTTSP